MSKLLSFEYFPEGISVQNLYHMCIYPKQAYISKKNNQKMLFQNGGQKKNFRFAIKVTWPKFEKPLSQWNFSIKFGFKLKNMNRPTFTLFFEIKFEQNYLGAKKSCDIVQYLMLLISVKMARPIYFLTKRCVTSISVAITQKEWEKIFTRFNMRRGKRNHGSKTVDA